MKVYNIQIPFGASGTIYRDKDNVWRHTQDPIYPAPNYLLSNLLWNAATKKFDKINIDYSCWPDRYDANSFDEDSCYVHKKDLQEFLDIHISLVRDNMKNIDYEEEMSKYNIFILHSDLYRDLIYVSVVGVKGIGETLWEKP